MRNKLILLLLSALPLAAAPRQKAQGYCEQGGQTVTVNASVTSTGKTMKSYPGCTVTIYNVGTTNLSTIYSDDAGTPKSNPFTADVTTGAWFFYADDGEYDVRTSGAGISPTFTRGDYQLLDWKFLQNGAAAVARPIKNKLTEWVSITDFGAVGDGSTDNIAALTAAYESVEGGGTVWWPCGEYNFSGTIPLTAKIVTQGASRDCVIARNTNNSVYAFNYLSAISAPYDENVGIRFSDITLISRNGLQFNRETIPTPPSYQGNLLGIKIEHSKIRGDYDTQTDPDRWTAVKPALSALKAFGILISCNSCFNMVITDTQVQFGGIGVYWQGDENIIEGFSRVTFNGVNVYIDGANFHANWNQIRSSIISANYRYGAITLVSSFYPLILGIVHENYCPSSNFIYSRSSYGMMYAYNTITDPNQPILGVDQGCETYDTNSTPILDLDDVDNDIISYNTMELGDGQIPPMLFGHTYWTAQRPMQYSVTNNNEWWPTPDGLYTFAKTAPGVVFPEEPGVAIAPINPLIFKANNIPHNDIQGVSPVNFSSTFYQSPATGRWVLKPGSFILPLGTLPGYGGFYEFQFTARKVSTGAGTVVISYRGNSVTPIFSGTLNFSNAAEVESRSVVPQILGYQIPSGEITTGTWEIAIGDDAEYESIRLTPIKKPQAFPTFSTTPTFNLADSSTQRMTLTGNVTGPNFINGTVGQTVIMFLCQDATGGRTFAWPSTVPQKFYGAGVINPNPSQCSYQTFQFDGENYKAITPMMFDDALYVTGSADWNPGFIADGAVASTTVSAPGVNSVAVCGANFSSIGSALVMVSAQVSAVDTVKVIIMNKTGGPIDPADGAVTVFCRRQ